MLPPADKSMKRRILFFLSFLFPFHFSLSSLSNNNKEKKMAARSLKLMALSIKHTRSYFRPKAKKQLSSTCPQEMFVCVSCLLLLHSISPWVKKEEEKNTTQPSFIVEKTHTHIQTTYSGGERTWNPSPAGGENRIEEEEKIKVYVCVCILSVCVLGNEFI